MAAVASRPRGKKHVVEKRIRIAEAFYTRLIANTRDPQRITSLSRIRAACDDIERDQDEYTVADVGRHCVERWGGPKAQSIRNSPDVLLKYIKLRIAEHLRGAPAHADKAPATGEMPDFSDPVNAQHRFLLALGEIEQLKREVSRLRLRLEGFEPSLADELVALTTLRA